MTIEDWSAMDYNVRVLPSRWFKSGARQRAGLAVSGEQMKAEVFERCQKSQPDKRVCVVK